VASFLGALALAASVFFLFYQFWGNFDETAQVAILLGALGAMVLAVPIGLLSVRRSGIYFAMVGLIMALPDTMLETRMRKEGRLIAVSEGDNFQPTNIRTVLPEHDLIRGFIRVLERLYDPDAYYERAYLAISQWNMARRRRAERYEWLAGVRSVFYQGFRSPDRRAYRRFMARVARLDPAKIPSAFALAITAHHMLEYAREEVLPRLRAYAATLSPA